MPELMFVLDPSNTLFNMSSEPPQIETFFYLRPPINYLLAAVFGFLILFSISGNLLVLMIIMKFKRMRTRTNLLLGNMSAVNLLMGLLAMPFSMMTAMNGGWLLGHTACQVNGFFNAMFSAMSIHTLMYISIHKYFSIKNVFRTTITTRHILGMMVITWIWGMLFATGLVAGWTSIEYKPGTTQCGPKVPDRNNLRESTHSIFTSVMNFVIPLAVIVFCYVSIFRTFHRHIASLGEEEQSNIVSAQQRALLQQKKIAITLIIVLICFLICIFPYILYSSVLAFAKNKLIVPKITNPLAYICLYFGSCINPVIYALRSQAFRAAYKTFFQFLCCKEQISKHIRAEAEIFDSSDNSNKSGWRRLSMAIHDVFHFAGSRETLSSTTRSRQNSLFSIKLLHSNGRASLRSDQLIHTPARKAISAETYRFRSSDKNQQFRRSAVDVNDRCPQHAQNRLGTRTLSSAILEERSSQLANWSVAKNPETDSGKADSVGDCHDTHDEPQESQETQASTLVSEQRLFEKDGGREKRPLLVSSRKFDPLKMSIDYV